MEVVEYFEKICAMTVFATIVGMTQVLCRIAYANVFTRIPAIGFSCIRMPPVSSCLRGI